MGQKRVALIVVPGKTDRSFYKAMFRKLFKYYGFQVIDLDSKNHEHEKLKILGQIFKIREKSPIYRASVLKISSTNVHLFIVIWSTDKKIPTSTADVLNYQAGLTEPTIDFIVATEDAENLSFEQRLNSLYMSISNNCVQELKFKEIEPIKSTYYRIYQLEKDDWLRTLLLMLLVQGLQLSPVNKHAIEDFVIVPILEETKDELTKICDRLLDKVIQDPEAHKKLALLLAIIKCVVSIEDLIFDIFTEKEFLDIIENHDGLRKLVDVLISLLGGKSV